MKTDARHHKGVSKRKPVARFNPDPAWPDGYFEVLAEAGVPERQRSFCTHWVRQFFHCHPGRARRALGAGEIRQFLLALKADPGMAPWQIEQAKMALILYYEQFRGIGLGDVSELDTPEPEDKRKCVAEDAPARRIPPPREVPTLKIVPDPRNDVPGARRADMSKLRNAVLTALRTEHYALKTEKVYWQWIRAYVAHHHGRRPSEMGAAEIHAFLRSCFKNPEVETVRVEKTYSWGHIQVSLLTLNRKANHEYLPEISD
jgi:hypothetical protein